LHPDDVVWHKNNGGWGAHVGETRAPALYCPGFYNQEPRLAGAYVWTYSCRDGTAPRSRRSHEKMETFGGVCFVRLNWGGTLVYLATCCVFSPKKLGGSFVRWELFCTRVVCGVNGVPAVSDRNSVVFHQMFIMVFELGLRSVFDSCGIVTIICNITLLFVSFP